MSHLTIFIIGTQDFIGEIRHFFFHVVFDQVCGTSSNSWSGHYDSASSSMIPSAIQSLNSSEPAGVLRQKVLDFWEFHRVFVHGVLCWYSSRFGAKLHLLGSFWIDGIKGVLEVLTYLTDKVFISSLRSSGHDHSASRVNGSTLWYFPRNDKVLF